MACKTNWAKNNN